MYQVEGREKGQLLNIHLLPIAVTALSSSAILSRICATCDPNSSNRLLSSDPDPTTDDI